MTLPASVKQSNGDLLTSFVYASDATPPAGWQRPTALYRFFDAEGKILYVGITGRLRRRMTEHAKDYATTWWPLVVSRTVEWHQTRSEAGRAERQAIAAEKPPHNVLHTPRARVPLQARPNRNYGQRGIPLLRLAQQHFDLEPFTAADALHAAKCSSATVNQWIKALADRGWLVRVGTRFSVSKHKGVPIREHALWAIPDSEAAHVGTAVIQYVDVSDSTHSPGPRRRGSATGGGNRWDSRYPGGRDQSLLQIARDSFGHTSFTRGQLAEAAGAEVQSIAKYLRMLRESGQIIPVGKAERPAGKRGHAPVLYAVAAEVAW